MPNVYSALGFRIDGEQAFGMYAMMAAVQGQAVPAPGGRYGRLAAGAGAELWVQVDERGAISGLQPHLAGESRFVLRLDTRVPSTEESPLDGAFQAWAGEAEGNDASGFPLVFHAPDFRTLDGLSLPARLPVQLAAIAYGLTAFPDEEAYYAAQETEPKFAAESFIPSGMFNFADDAGTLATPEPRALFSGTVLDTEWRTNPLTGLPFCRMRVRTLGGEVDVAADPETVDGEIVVGGIVRGEFWMTGRINPDAPPPAPAAAQPAPASKAGRRPWWRRLFGG
ncbi:MAG TPA: hypothetical protein VFQ45_06550 [Longimicrobium sp.]|nr:hypothetical protein [Longimicrobium sp.]